MKITKRGTPPEELVWHGRCAKCGTEAEEFEAQLDPKSDFREGRFAELPCPVCGDRMFFYPPARRTR